MISAVALCPRPPALVPAGARGAAGELVAVPLALTIGAWLVREVPGSGSGAVGSCVGRAQGDGPAAGEAHALPPAHDVALPVMGAGLHAAGVGVWHAAGRQLSGGCYGTDVLYAEHPHGVSYVVAGWTARG